MSKAWNNGDVNAAPLMVGQSIGLIDDIPSCAELLQRMEKEAETQIKKIYSNIL